MGAPMRYSIIISVFNRLDLTQTLLENLWTFLNGRENEVIVVDDCSTDETRPWLMQLRHQSLRVLLNERNVGYAAANNRAAATASKETLLFLNNDLALRPDWLQPLLRSLDSNPNAFAVGNVQLNARSGQIDHWGVTFNELGFPVHIDSEPKPDSEGLTTATPVVTFACVAVRRKRFLALGGFDESYRNGFEDVDLCLRARARGWPSYVANFSKVDHHVSASPGRKDAESANAALFARRWKSLTIQIGRDWDERLIRKRAGRNMPSPEISPRSRRNAPNRILVDLSMLAAEQIEALFSAKLGPFISSISRVAPTALIFEVLVSPKQIRHVAGVSGYFDCVWMLPGGFDAYPAPSNVRRLTTAEPTLARSLLADLLFLPLGESQFAAHDIPIISGVGIRAEETEESIDRLARISFGFLCGSIENSQRLQNEHRVKSDQCLIADSLRTRFGGGVPYESTLERDATHLAAMFQRALDAFEKVGSAWFWDHHADRREPAQTPDAASEDDLLMQIDEPTRWDDPVPLLQIRGWCLSNRSSPVASVFVRSIDGVWEGVYGLSRPDVAVAFPDHENAATSGFILRLMRPTQTPGPISIEVKFEDGHHVAAVRPVVA